MTFTCMVHDGPHLEWISDAFSGAPELFSLFLADDEVGVSRMYGQFTTNLTRLVPTPGSPGLGDITSTLVFVAAAEHDGIVIQCTDLITPLSVSLAGIYVSTLPVSYLGSNYCKRHYTYLSTHMQLSQRCLLNSTPLLGVSTTNKTASLLLLSGHIQTVIQHQMCSPY